MISVIIAAKDAEKWISQTLQSLLLQSYEDWECILSINGSKDSTLEICSSINDNRFRIITSDTPNKSIALNRAIFESSREFISILDSDDLWEKDKLKSQIDYFGQSNIDICGTQMSYIEENGKQFKEAPFLPLDHDNCVLWLNNYNNPIANSSVLYKKSIHNLVGYYDPEKFAVEDYDMWMRSKRAGLKFSNLHQKLMKHRIHLFSNFNSSEKQVLNKRLVDSIEYFYSTQ